MVEESFTTDGADITNQLRAGILPAGAIANMALRADSIQSGLELDGVHSLENLRKLLDLLSANLKTTFLQLCLAVEKQLMQLPEGASPAQHQQIRLLFAEEMMKKHFMKQTLEALSDFNKLIEPEQLFSESQTARHFYPIFMKWVTYFKTEVFVVEFRQLSEACGMHMIDPTSYPRPVLDYSHQLPATMTPHKLIYINTKIWEIQTTTALELISSSPIKPNKMALDISLGHLFEAHRIQAYHEVMGLSTASKLEAHVAMVKAYVTYASSDSLDGYQNGGESWMADYNQAIKENLLRQEEAIAQSLQ